MTSRHIFPAPRMEISGHCKNCFPTLKIRRSSYKESWECCRAVASALYKRPQPRRRPELMSKLAGHLLSKRVNELPECLISFGAKDNKQENPILVEGQSGI